MEHFLLALQKPLSLDYLRRWQKSQVKAKGQNQLIQSGQPLLV